MECKLCTGINFLSHFQYVLGSLVSGVTEHYKRFTVHSQ